MSSPRTAKLNIAEIDTQKLNQEIDALEPAARSLRDVISDLRESIKRATDRGVTPQQICEHLAKRGVIIKPTTLLRYLRNERTARAPSPSLARAAADAASELASDNQKR